jgi:hypothetical protein
MFRSLLPSVTPVLLAATAAPAALVVNVDHVRVESSAGDQTVSLDVYLVDSDGVNERLNGFNVALTGAANTRAGVRFLPPSAYPSKAHPYVFRQFPGLGPDDIRADYAAMFAGQVTQTAEINVSDEYNGLYAVSVLVPGGTPAGTYPITVNTDGTTFSFIGPTIPWSIGPPGGVTVVPEPAAAVCLLALPLLRRRRMGRPL